ncbi:MAG: MFS transporter [Proteobacteria bacterium]|nr:MFS transporter [Pseudomonadota bacterium]
MSAATPSTPLAIADFRLFWLARLTSVTASTGLVVVLGYQVYDLARSGYGMSIAAASFQLGILGLVQFLPMALLTPIAGVVADRHERRRVAATANLLVVAMALTLALVTRTGVATLPLLFLLAALLGVARAFFGPAMSATIANIVPAELMPKAIATSSIAWQTASVVGPAAGGVLYAVRPDLTYWAAAALTGIAVTAVISIRRIPPPEGNREAHPFRQMAEGLAFVRNERFLLGCITLDLFAVLLGGATALLPVYARDFLFVDGVAVGSRGLGLMRAAPGLGAALVAGTLALRPLNHRVGTLMLGSVGVFGLVTALFGMSRNFHLSLALLVLLGAADMVSVFIRSTLIQLNTPNAMRGRVSSISGLAISASNELGEMESGLLAALAGAPAAVIAGGLGAMAITAIWARLFPELRRADTFAPQYRDGAPT